MSKKHPMVKEQFFQQRNASNEGEKICLLPKVIHLDG